MESDRLEDAITIMVEELDFKNYPVESLAVENLIEKMHHIRYSIDESDNVTAEQIRLVKEYIKSESDDSMVIDEKDFLDTVEPKMENIDTREQLKAIIDKMKRRGDLFEPKNGKLQLF